MIVEALGAALVAALAVTLGRRGARRIVRDSVDSVDRAVASHDALTFASGDVIVLDRGHGAELVVGTECQFEEGGGEAALRIFEATMATAGEPLGDVLLIVDPLAASTFERLEIEPRGASFDASPSPTITHGDERLTRTHVFDGRCVARAAEGARPTAVPLHVRGRIARYRGRDERVGLVFAPDRTAGGDAREHTDASTRTLRAFGVRVRVDRCELLRAGSQPIDRRTR